MEDLSGQSFGVYRIVAPLGTGGMASVYQAYQPAVDRHVALKVLPRHLAKDPEYLARFEQEAKLLAKLQHPHILPVHDFGESDGFTYIVMPFIKTGGLDGSLTGQPLALDQLRRVITQVGDALDCAHAQGLVHRDVKPSNILIDERGNCLLADFGIAKILEGADTLTATGFLIGTPKYMSPEQGMGKPIDGRSDIYSLGVVLYEMATGEVPFQAETPMAVVVKHIHDPLPVPTTVNPDLPESIQRMIFRAMHKEPDQRFPTARVMVEAMAAVSSTAPLSANVHAETMSFPGLPPRPSVEPEVVTPPLPDRPTGAGGGRHRQIALAVAAVVILVLLLVRFWPQGSEETLPDAATDARRAEPTAPLPATVEPPATAPVELITDAVVDSMPASAEPTATSPPPARATGAPPSPPPAVAAVDAGADEVAEPEAALRAALDLAERDRARRDLKVNARDAFPNQGDGTFLDGQAGVRWTAESEPRQGADGLLWVDANDYCARLTLAGRSDWRLPTQPELDSLLQRLEPGRYPWGLTLWSADRLIGEPNRLWVTNSPLYGPEWSTEVRDAFARRFTHRAVCVSAG